MIYGTTSDASPYFECIFLWLAKHPNSLCAGILRRLFEGILFWTAWVVVIWASARWEIWPSKASWILLRKTSCGNNVSRFPSSNCSLKSAIDSTRLEEHKSMANLNLFPVSFASTSNHFWSSIFDGSEYVEGSVRYQEGKACEDLAERGSTNTGE